MENPKLISSKFVVLFIVLSFLSCAERENEHFILQYEADLKKNVSKYEFVDFEWFSSYTLKDSLKAKIEEAIIAYDEAGDEATRYIDRNKYESQDLEKELNSKLAEIKINHMEALNDLIASLQSEYDAIPKKEDKVLRKKAIHTFKAQKNGGEEVYKVMVTFDGKDNFLEKGIAVDALLFENMLEIGKAFQN